jgi:hypothetical protein
MEIRTPAVVANYIVMQVLAMMTPWILPWVVIEHKVADACLPEAVEVVVGERLHHRAEQERRNGAVVVLTRR